MDELSALLNIRTGVTAVIGGGGKTTLLQVLARELSARGTVLLATSTHIRPMPGMPLLTRATEADIRTTLQRAPCACVGERAAEGKLTAPRLLFCALQALADDVLVEADGARRLPLKAHQPGEPVIPDCANQTIAVVGLSALGRPIREVAHRPELYARLCGCDTDAPVTPEMIARVLEAEGLHDRVFLNQLDDVDDTMAARVAERLRCPVCAGSLRRGKYRCLSS